MTLENLAEYEGYYETDEQLLSELITNTKHYWNTLTGLNCERIIA